MNRHLMVALGLALLLAVPGRASEAQAATPTGTQAPRRAPAMVELLDVLEQSQKSGKGVLLYLGSQAIGGVVNRINEHTVELKNREYGGIILRLDRIDGVASN